MNILDYLDWRGDIRFDERRFNDIDNLIFATLAYTNMENIVSSDSTSALTLAQVYEQYTQLGYHQSHMIINPEFLLEKAAKSERYKNVLVRHYVNKIDVKKQLQFFAVTFVFGNNIYVAYRGTDNTLVGWREDCNMSYLPETAGQREAVEYLNETADISPNTRLYVGGHSKGGNFAVYAAAFCDGHVKDRITRIYSNDGPGFNSKIANSEEYLAVIPKTTHIITDSSIVGILLSSKTPHLVIKSSAMGIDQHNPYTWNVFCTEFEKADGLSQASVFMNDTTSRWIDSLNDENKKLLINSVFDSLEASGATTLNDISAKKWEVYNSVWKAMIAMSADKKTEIGTSLKKLFDAGKDVVRKNFIRQHSVSDKPTEIVQNAEIPVLPENVIQSPKSDTPIQ